MKRTIRTLEEAREHNLHEAALVEVPGEFVRLIYFLMRTLRHPRSERRKKAVESLLRTVGARR